eukprot:gene10018-2337_t
MRVGFIHPDLGIGGAERLVVDAGLGLQDLGHEIEFFTSHHSKDHCFEETKNGTLKVNVYGDFLPRNILGFFHIFFAILRMLYVSLIVCLFHKKFDVLFVDQVSVNILILKLFSSSKIVFYCHHPDKLLVKSGANIIKKLYRIPFDYLEEKTTGMSDTILVNSKYTQDVFKAEFKSIKKTTEILYPAINLNNYDIKPDEKPTINLTNKIAITSVNRFENKKNIPLAVKAFALLKNKYQNFNDLILVIGGGYDPRVDENKQVLDELKSLIKELKIEDKVTFLPSFSNADRYVLFHESRVITYTPKNEHFGIVPVEAQYGGRFVIACNSGGPLETISHGKTGFLVDPKPEAFAEAILKVLEMKNEEYEKLSKTARQNVIDKFSLKSFSNKLNKIITDL